MVLKVTSKLVDAGCSRHQAGSHALAERPPGNKAKVEQAFGPEEFNRLEYAIEAVLERLPDLAPNKDDKVVRQRAREQG